MNRVSPIIGRLSWTLCTHYRQGPAHLPDAALIPITFFGILQAHIEYALLFFPARALRVALFIRFTLSRRSSTAKSPTAKRIPAPAARVYLADFVVAINDHERFPHQGTNGRAPPLPRVRVGRALHVRSSSVRMPSDFGSSRFGFSRLSLAILSGFARGASLRFGLLGF